MNGMMMECKNKIKEDRLSEKPDEWHNRRKERENKRRGKITDQKSSSRIKIRTDEHQNRK